MATAKSQSVHLAGRVASLEAEWRWLHGLLTWVEKQGAGLPRKDELALVRERMEGAVGRSIDPLRPRIEQLKASRRSAAERWSELDAIAKRLDAAAADLLPVAQGALARAAGVDRGVCALAEELVAFISGRTVGGERVVVPAAADHTSTGAWVIGLAMHEEGVWSLPVVAHELSHVAAMDLRDHGGQLLAKALIEGGWRDDPSLPVLPAGAPGPLPFGRASELFADLFGAYCVGPAYAAALMARSVAVGAWAGHGDHPPDAARLRAVLRLLEGHPAGWVSDFVRSDWKASLRAAGEVYSPVTATTAAVDGFTRRAVEVLDLTASRARFEGGDAVLEVGQDLRKGTPPPPDADLRTVINGAWGERVRDARSVPKIESAVSAWMSARPRPNVGAG
ncbi:MAG: hypothetical protein ACRD12_06235 [Acidimicrobiales bacterium]